MSAADDLCARVATATAVVARGAATQWEVGGSPAADDPVVVHAPAEVVRYEPADMTITVGAGLDFDTLDAVVAEHGQECPLDPRSRAATVGGILACGLSGPRRLRHGPARDHVLEVRLVTADGRHVKGGGPTVKNVTGYDLPRLFVGSLGTLGVLTQVTLRCRPRPRAQQWFVVEPDERFHRPSARLWNGTRECILVEGSEGDVRAQRNGHAACDPPVLPDGPHRGRISVAPNTVRAVANELTDVRWCAEIGVGTVHVASDSADALAGARAVAHRHGGWMLREAGGPRGDGIGRPLPNLALMRRIKKAFDPTGKLNAGRLPL